MLAGLKWTGVWNIEDSSTDLLYCAKFNNDRVDVNRQMLSTSMVSRRQEEHKRLSKRERLIQFSSALMNSDRVDVNKQLLSTSIVSRRQEEHKGLYYERTTRPFRFASFFPRVLLKWNQLSFRLSAPTTVEALQRSLSR